MVEEHNYSTYHSPLSYLYFPVTIFSTIGMANDKAVVDKKTTASGSGGNREDDRLARSFPQMSNLTPYMLKPEVK